MRNAWKDFSLRNEFMSLVFIKGKKEGTDLSTYYKHHFVTRMKSYKPEVAQYSSLPISLSLFLSKSPSHSDLFVPYTSARKLPFYVCIWMYTQLLLVPFINSLPLLYTDIRDRQHHLPSSIFLNLGSSGLVTTGQVEELSSGQDWEENSSFHDWGDQLIMELKFVDTFILFKITSRLHLFPFGHPLHTFYSHDLARINLFTLCS